MAQKQEKTTQKSIWAHYHSALGSLWYVFILAAIMYSVSSAIGGVLVPIFYKNIIDAVTNATKASQIFHFFILLLVATVVQFMFSRTYEYIESHFLSRALTRISSYALTQLTKHSYQFFTNTFSGSLVNKIRKFVNAYETLTDMIVMEFLYAIVNIIGILGVLFFTSRILGVATFACFLLFFYFIIFFTKRRIPLEKVRGETESHTTGVLSDIVTNVLNLKLFSSKDREGEYFDHVLGDEHDARIKAWMFANHAYTVNGVITYASQMFLIFLSILLWRDGLITSGTIVLVMSYNNILFSRLGSLGSAIRRFTDAYTNATEFTEIINEDIEIKDPKRPEKLHINHGEINFDHVDFAYKSGTPILTDFNLYIAPGEKIGVVGTSGAGKTTITKLLLRFADVTGGAIRIDGQDVRKITQDDLRSTISYVPQDPILFHRTLRENIAYGKPDATDEEIIEAAKQAHAHDFIESLSHGYDTLVGERGIKLSGGERQRVAIARAILKNAPILILDEATSSLDSVSETHIKEALDTLMRGKTTVVIAHRLSTIEKMDRIIVMEKGEIVEEGNHTELLSKKGVYWNFWNHQYKGFIK